MTATESLPIQSQIPVASMSSSFSTLYRSIWNKVGRAGYSAIIVKLALVTSLPAMPKALAIPLTIVVLPLPRSPKSATTSPGFRRLPRAYPNSSVRSGLSLASFTHASLDDFHLPDNPDDLSGVYYREEMDPLFRHYRCYLLERRFRCDGGHLAGAYLGNLRCRHPPDLFLHRGRTFQWD